MRPDGKEMTAEDWKDAGNHVLGMLIRADATDEIDERGRRVTGETVLLLVNAGGRTKLFTLPMLGQAGTWTEIVNTSHRVPRAAHEASVSLGARSLMLFRYEPRS